MEKKGAYGQRRKDSFGDKRESLGACDETSWFEKTPRADNLISRLMT